MEELLVENKIIVIIGGTEEQRTRALMKAAKESGRSYAIYVGREEGIVDCSGDFACSAPYKETGVMTYRQFLLEENDVDLEGLASTRILVIEGAYTENVLRRALWYQGPVVLTNNSGSAEKFLSDYPAFNGKAEVREIAC
jgi:hypothetical protein